MELHYLETHLVDHCNLNCKGCGHFAPLSKVKFTDLNVFKKDFLRLRELFYNILNIRLMGGEPLLHPDILNFLEVARSTFPDSKISLVTNGILLINQSDAFWEKCADNDIIIDITRYPIKLDSEAIEQTGKHFNVKFKEGWTVTHFEKYINMAGESDPILAFRHCQSIYKCIFLHDGKIYICRLPALIHIFNEYFKKKIPVCDKDYIDIHEDVSGSDIWELLNHPTPFCRWCLVEWPNFEWGISKRKLSEWIPTGPDGELKVKSIF